ncbi:hypothetical protein [Acidovorax sp. NCPPB 4044]|uniref:hypothetical protein n=1 Tax=Acidovorax sp. NCPPB 4044 TaxID=2940490 RepID=UPI0023028F41|nr:hypothetical protein [Acidovorax sp. NCPPB 4044]MDA8521971.1 hypothetical protein [Acidovorax sp. NCPPB 4044]
MDLAKLMGQGGGGSAELWSASATIEQGALVISPLDKEVYRRVAATGTSATDPADDLTNYVAASYPRTTSLPIGYTLPHIYPDNVRGVTRTGQTNIAQATRTQVLSVTGRGSLLHAGAWRSANQGETAGLRNEIWADGRKLVEWESTAAGGHYVTVLGASFKVGDDLIAAAGAPVVFRRSLVIWITPTYRAWTGSTEYVTYSLRTEA